MLIQRKSQEYLKHWDLTRKTTENLSNPLIKSIFRTLGADIIKWVDSWLEMNGCTFSKVGHLTVITTALQVKKK